MRNPNGNGQILTQFSKKRKKDKGASLMLLPSKVWYQITTQTSYGHLRKQHGNHKETI